jgi:hypothetical protein
MLSPLCKHLAKQALYGLCWGSPQNQARMGEAGGAVVLVKLLDRAPQGDAAVATAALKAIGTLAWRCTANQDRLGEAGWVC